MEETMTQEIPKMELTSLNVQEDQLAKLKAVFPEVFNEDKVDWDKLRRTLGETIDIGDERYGMNWPGKSNCFRVIQEPSIGTLKPCKEESVEWDSTENLFIEGDNLEVIKLLQQAYYGKVRMVYIDPPYNTGNDFIYPDNYTESLDTYLKYTGQIDAEGRKYSTNAETDGRFHSKWINMIYPRLFLAKNLLTDDGVIFISVNNTEISNLRMIMNEIFGEENFIECIVWNKRIPKNDKGIGNIHEYILLYAKNIETKPKFLMPKDGIEEVYEFVEKLKRKRTPIPEAESELKRFYNKKGYDRGITLYNSLDENYEIWGKINLNWPNAQSIGPDYDVLHPATNIKVKVPDRGWRWKRDTFDQYLDYSATKKLHDGSYVCGKIWFAKDENTQPSYVQYLKDVNDFLLRSIISLKSSGGMEVEQMLGQNIFPYPKPYNLIYDLILSFTEKDDLILDFFAGSGTTGQAVYELNKFDEGKRRFICVQLPEATEDNSEARKKGYKNLADIGKQRLRCVSAKFKESDQSQLSLGGNPKQDFGFRVFKLTPSNFKIWSSQIQDENSVAKQIELFINHLDPNSSDDDILFEILSKAGFELTTKIETLDLAGKKVYSIAGDALLICLERQLTKEVITEMASRQPARVVCLDTGFDGNDQLKTNAVQIMKSHGVTDFKTV